MFDEMLKKYKPWTVRATDELYLALEDYFDEDKCDIICKIANELIKRKTARETDYAKKLLVHATQKYFNVDDSSYKAKVYYALGSLYEISKQDYIKAYTAYEKYTLNNTVNGRTHSLLLRALILRDDFTYSDELEKELRFSYSEADLGLRADRLYEAIAGYIVATHDGDAATADTLKKRMKAICKADEIFVLDMVMKKDDIRDVLEVPQKVKEFVENI